VKYLKDFQPGRIYRFRSPPLSTEERGVLAYTLRARNPAGEVVFTTKTPMMIQRRASRKR